jgi:hypothetical protein
LGAVSVVIGSSSDKQHEPVWQGQAIVARRNAAGQLR